MNEVSNRPISIEAQARNNVEALLNGNRGHEFSTDDIRTHPQVNQLLGHFGNDRISMLCLELARNGIIKRVKAEPDPAKPTLRYKYRAYEPGEQRDLSLIPSSPVSRTGKKMGRPTTASRDAAAKAVTPTSANTFANATLSIKKRQFHINVDGMKLMLEGNNFEVTYGDTTLKLSYKGV